MKKNFRKLAMYYNIADQEDAMEIGRHIAKVETLATMLRGELEELQDLVWRSEVSVYDEDGEQLTHYELEDMASAVAEIEEIFEERD